MLRRIGVNGWTCAARAARMARSAAALMLAAPLYASAAPAAIDLVRAHEQERIEVMARAAPSVVAIFEESRAGGGSGVVITPDGYGLTNFHVVAGLMETRRGLAGMADGRLYPLQVLGIDVTGDLAMFKLEARPVGTATGEPVTPPGPGFTFTPAPIADSDTVQVGDWCFAMGNPFLLAEDFTPTVTHGLVSGTQRYQFGADGRNLVYTDCIQVDASINPGNSGGPLFNMRGEVIGINGRASFEQRGRVNVGLGYAISSNQVVRFIPGLRAGLLVEHGTMNATTIDLGYQRVVFERMFEPSAASVAGIQVGDRLISFGGRKIHSANQFLNVLGTYPAWWPVQVTFERDGKLHTRVVRLEPLSPNLPAPFEVDEILNRREVERVLRAARQALGTLPPDVMLTWEGSRLTWESELLRAIAPGHPFTVRQQKWESGSLQFVGSGASVERTLDYNGRTAQVRAADQAAASADPLDAERLNLWLLAGRALYALPELPDTMPASGPASAGELLRAWRHVGGDEYQGRVVDCLEVDTAGGPIRISFDPTNGLPVRVFRRPASPPDSSTVCELEPGDFRPVGTARLPHAIRALVAGRVAGIDLIAKYRLEDAK